MAVADVGKETLSGISVPYFQSGSSSLPEVVDDVGVDVEVDKIEMSFLLSLDSDVIVVVVVVVLAVEL